MTLLAIETATDVCGVAVVEEGRTLALREIHLRHIHAEQLPGLAGAALEAAGRSVADLQAVAVSTGPGSFTGLRIGLSTAKGIAWAAGIPLVGVPTLEALALRVAEAAAEGWILTALDARRNDVYAQLFRSSGGRVEPAGDVLDLALSGVAEYVAGRPVVIAGDAAETVASALAAAGSPCAPAPERFGTCSAAAVGMLGIELAHAGRHADPRTLEPLYIKEFFLRVR